MAENNKTLGEKIEMGVKQTTESKKKYKKRFSIPIIMLFSIPIAERKKRINKIAERIGFEHAFHLNKHA